MKACCTDREGNPKKKYPTREEAESIAQLRGDEGAGFKVYQCEEGDGWHLTSLNVPPPARPRNVMIDDDRRFCTKKIATRLENVLGEAKSKMLKCMTGKNTLQKLKADVDQLEREVIEKAEVLITCRNEFLVLRGNLNEAEQDLRETRQQLSRARLELDLARRRIG